VVVSCAGSDFVRREKQAGGLYDQHGSLGAIGADEYQLTRRMQAGLRAGTLSFILTERKQHKRSGTCVDVFFCTTTMTNGHCP
jgi:hypothetical protein